MTFMSRGVEEENNLRERIEAVLGKSKERMDGVRAGHSGFMTSYVIISGFSARKSRTVSDFVGVNSRLKELYERTFDAEEYW
jgi:hypothetical protein